MDVRFCESRNHRREARVRAAGSARVRGARSSEARLRRIFFSLTKTYMDRFVLLNSAANHLVISLTNGGQLSSTIFESFIGSYNYLCEKSLFSLLLSQS